jgi:hypothetical protein
MQGGGPITPGDYIQVSAGDALGFSWSMNVDTRETGIEFGPTTKGIWFGHVHINGDPDDPS